MYKVYIVDGDPSAIEFIVQLGLWEENRFRICGSETAPLKAVNQIIEMNPHLVICELKMPGIDGLEFIMELKRRGVQSEFILLSAYHSFSETRSFFLNDGFDYLLKPLNLLDLQISLERLGRKLDKKNMPSGMNLVSGNGAKSRIDDIMDYIVRNYHKKITLQLLGEKFHLSPNYICNLFSKHYNLTLSAIIRSIRMKEAARMLESTKKPLKAVSIDCGYTNYFYFCRVFKSYFHMTPSEYVLRFRR